MSKRAGNKPNPSKLVELLLDETAFWQLIFLIGVTLIASLWNLDGVRKTVFELVGVDRTGWVEAALEDPNDQIAANACTAILTNDDEILSPKLVRTLYRRPEVAFLCLEQSTEVIEARRQARDQEREERATKERHNPFHRDEPELVPRHEFIASTIGRRWTTDLFEGTNNACETAYSARRALEYANLDPTYRLMSCAIAADSSEVRQCCVNQLGGHERFAELLDRPDLVPLRQASLDYPALVGASFPSVPVASQFLGRRPRAMMSRMQPPTEPVEDGEERFEDLQFEVQDWAVDVGCRLHFHNASRREVPAAFVAMVESDGCAPTEPPWSGMYEASNWSRVCLGMYEYRRSLAYTPRQSLCDSLSRATLDQTVSVTKLLVAASVSEARQTPGVRKESLEIVGDENFGARIYGFRRGRPVELNEEPESNWRDSGEFGPMGGM